ncbi:MarR family transcriptional regulator [Streptosporangium sp. NPDC051023]|uniref:MarR family winged helix-turn-helix transcriptional regulator n=1 Tax=Streptosporangium sp. NPDC051023 TaxID=3155410 RepID=UPI00344F5326
MSWDRFVVLHTRVEAELARSLQRGHGLGLSEYRALAELAEAPGGELRMQELSGALGLNQSSVTRLAARLEGAGLTRRNLCVDDRRGVYTVITDGGRARLAEAMPTYERSLVAALERANADPALSPLIAVVRGS